MKNVLQIFTKGISFYLIFIIIFINVSELFIPTWTNVDATKPGIETFYNQPRNSIDVIFLGTSSYRNGISPLMIWEETGITSYLRATSGQHPIVDYYYLVEALKYQHPKVVMIDGISLYKNSDVDKNESSLRKSIDPLRFSLEKIHMILDIISKSEKQSFLSYVFPLLRYHDRWKEQLTRDDFESIPDENYDPLKGQYLTRGSKSYTMPNYLLQTTNENNDYDDQALLYYQKIIDLCKEQGIELIFLSLPRIADYDYSMHLGIKSIADEMGIKFYDYNLPDLYYEAAIDSLEDFQNETHLNVYGSIKISVHLGAILQHDFNLPDRRNSDLALQWNQDLEYFKRQF